MSSPLRLLAFSSFFVLCYSLPNSAVAQKARDFSVVVDDMVAKLGSTPIKTQPLRLAVIPFGNTQSQTSNRFGEYVTESIVSRLSGNPNKYKIFERKRLDAIIKEDELSLSELMLPESAQKLGKLVPIDALFSGTYTKLKTYVDLNARLIDVSSGEIIVSFSERVKMTKNLRALFEEGDDDIAPAVSNSSGNGNPPKDAKAGVLVVAGKASRKEVCDQLEKDFKTKLSDLSSEEKVKNVVREAIAIPFDNTCGKIHYGTMYTFSRYKIRQSDYESFLLTTVDTIAFPNQDERAIEILRYVTRDSIVTEREWRSGLGVISKVGDYTLSTYLNYLLAKTRSPEEELRARTDAYFRLASDRKIGLPQPVVFNVAFFEMMEGVKSNQSLRQYVYEKYAPGVALDTRSASTVYGELHSMYMEESDRERKKKIIRWMADFFNHHSDEKSHEHLYDMARSFELTLNEQRNNEIQAQFPEEDLVTFIDLTRPKFSEYAMKTPYQSQQGDRINICVKYNVPVPGVIPTMPEAEKILQGTDINEQLRVMKLVVQMGTRPQPLENSLIVLFSKRSLEDKERMTEIQALAMLTLGHIRTSNPTAISYMVSKLSSFNYAESENAAAALVEIGKPSVSPLIKSLDATTQQDGGLRYKIVVLLGKIGPAAKPAEASLKKLLTSNTNSDVRYAIEAALQAIQN